MNLAQFMCNLGPSAHIRNGKIRNLKSRNFVCNGRTFPWNFVTNATKTQTEKGGQADTCLSECYGDYRGDVYTPSIIFYTKERDPTKTKLFLKGGPVLLKTEMILLVMKRFPFPDTKDAGILYLLCFAETQRHRKERKNTWAAGLLPLSCCVCGSVICRSLWFWY